MNILDNNIYTENSIRTYTGKVFDLKILDPESICIEDIAHALSYTARFAGHLPVMYSVAQHSALACRLASKENKLAALLHDDSEAYIGDMPSPFKKMMPEYKAIEDNLMRVIADKYGFKYPLNLEIKKIDKKLLNIEWDSLVNKSVEINVWSPEESKIAFLSAFNSLSE